MTTDHLTLRVLRVAGYVNFAALTAVVFGAKGFVALWLPPAAPSLIAICGAALYYLAWPRLFPGISRAEGRRFMRPYLLGVYVLIGVALLLAVLAQPRWWHWPS